MPIDPELLQLALLPSPRLHEIDLEPQPTPSRQQGVSPSQAVAWLAGAPHNRVGDTLSPTIATIIDGMAETLDDNTRNTLVRPLLPTLTGTNDTSLNAENLRRHTALHWLIHTNLPEWLNLAGRDDFALLMQQLPSIRPGMPPQELRDVAQLVTGTIHAFDDPTWNTDAAASDAVAESGFQSVYAATIQMRIPHTPEVALGAARAVLNDDLPTAPTILTLQKSWAELVNTLALLTQ